MHFIYKWLKKCRFLTGLPPVKVPVAGRGADTRSAVSAIAAASASGERMAEPQALHHAIKGHLLWREVFLLFCLSQACLGKRCCVFLNVKTPAVRVPTLAS